MKLVKLLIGLVIVSLLVSMVIPMAAAPKPDNPGGGKPPKDEGDPADNEIAFVDTNYRGSIVTMTWEGTVRTYIYNSGYAIYPAWSADGSTIIFYEYMGPSGSGLYRIPSTGGSATLLTSTADTSSIKADWSPSPTPNGNEMIVFSDYDTNGDRNLFVIQPDGTGRQALTNDAYYQIHPTWSHQGDKIAVSKGDPSGRNHKIVVYDIAVDGNGDLFIASETDVTAIPGSPLNAANDIYTPAFARTSDDLLVFVVMNGVYDIWRIPDGDPENPIQLTDSANEGGYARNAAWKSDDTLFVHEGPKPKGRGEIAWKRDAFDGSNPTPVDAKRAASNYGTRP
jgi:hypothetical protein